MVLRRTVFCALCIVIFGCEREVDEGRTFAVVNGRPVTERYVRDVISVQAKMAEISGNKISDKGFAAWGNGLVARIFPGLITAEILAEGIENAKITPDSNDVKVVVEKYNDMFKRMDKTPEELYAAFGTAKDAFRFQFGRSCLFEAARRHFSTQEVSDAEVDEYMADKRILKQVADEIDKKGRENAEKAWRRLQAGEDWDKVAKECSEDRLVLPENEVFKDEWATVGADAMGYTALAEALRSLHVGDISKPIDIDEGLVIVKVLDEDQMRFTLARMLFRMAEPVTIPTAEKARGEVMAKKAAKAHDEFVERLRSKAKIEYPLGTNFNFKVFQ